ncbi:MAG: hypothetical protein B7Z31_11145 [Rhodobacterales bacterium 12-65-15]|nr:MAG: hypothetical protein B7Z31_11145 [Rhodobacterales bacterium 12-65-15]
MISLIVVNLNAVSEVSSDCVSGAIETANATACQAGAAIGGGIVAVGGWFLWFLGTLILGILMFATRGKLVTYDVVD